MERKQVFFKVFCRTHTKTITKILDGNVKTSELKQAVLKDTGFPEESEKDFLLLNMTTDGNSVSLDQQFICKDKDVFIMTKKSSLAESILFSQDSSENIGSSFWQLKERNNYPKADERKVLELDGSTLDHEKLLGIGNKKFFIKISESAKEKVVKSRFAIDDIVEKEEVVYGITTGFGKFKDKVIAPHQCKELQVNLITSHACGVGSPLTLMQTRMVMALRINVLAKGHSGIRLETLESIVAALNADCLPYIPKKGSVGASGDLAPLSHLAIGLMGQGQMWSPKTGWGDASEVLNFNGLKRVSLEAKEGLAMNNGTQVITALGAEALFRADMIARQADIVAAFTAEVLEGVPEQFAKDLHDVRPHPGQILTAARLWQLMHTEDGTVCSSIIQGRVARDEANDEKKNQDPYSIRCTPQVHGVVHETIAFVKAILNTEINSATDNPLVMLERSQDFVASAGNFHGEYPGMALDQLAIAIQEIANISERRIERLVHPDYLKSITAKGLPGFLVGGEEGLNNGFMILQYTAAALVSENKVLAHPSTVDSITTSGGSEDHVSMGTFAARKAVTVVENVENVIAIELLAACQALDLHRKENPNAKTTPPLEKVYQLVRKHAKRVDQDHYMAPDIVEVVRLLQEGKIWETVAEEFFTRECRRSLVAHCK